MAHHENLIIIAFIGKDPAIAQSVIDHYTEKGYPKVGIDDMASQITHLSEAGQHHLITDEITDFETYHQLRHLFPGELLLIALLPTNEIEGYKNNPSHDIQDWDEQKRDHHTNLLVQAQYYIETDGHETMFTQLNDLFENLNFIN